MPVLFTPRMRAALGTIESGGRSGNSRSRDLRRRGWMTISQPSGKARPKCTPTPERICQGGLRLVAGQTQHAQEKTGKDNLAPEG